MRERLTAEPRCGLAAIGFGFALGAGSYFIAADPPPNLAVVALLLLAIVGRLLQRISWPLAALVLGFCWSHLWACALLCNPFPDALAQQDVTIVGRIASLPDVTAERTRFLFAVERLSDAGPSSDFTGRVRLSWYKDAPQLKVGERWRFKVRLKTPHGFMNPGGFDYERWLFRQQVKATGYVRMQVAPQRLETGAGRYWLDRWRQGLRERLLEALPTGVGSALVPALVIGDRGALTPAQWSVFSRTGTSHLIAISGLHVGLVSAALFVLARRLWVWAPGLALRVAAPRAAAVAALFAALVYAALAGFSVSTQRALMMLAVVLLAMVASRTLRASSALSLALAAVLLVDPAAVLDYGFWLSFGAVAVLLYALGWRLGPPGWIARWGAAQWAVALGLLPLLIAFFGRASVIAPLVNLIAVPLFGLLLPIILIASLTFLLTGWALPLLVVDWLLDQGYSLLAFAASLPWASVSLGGRPDWVWLVAGLGALLLLAPRGLPGRWLGALLLLPLWLLRPPTPVPGSLEVTLLDVGQGLAAVMRTHRHTLVYDTGPGFRSGFNTGEAVIAPYLQHLGINSIDLLMVSHADQDHAGGVQGLLASVEARRILSGEPEEIERMLEGKALAVRASKPPTEKPLTEQQRQQADRHEDRHDLGRDGRRVETCRRGQQWHWDGVDFAVLHPTEPIEDGNNSSCVLRIVVGETALLWPGDAEASVERRLLQQAAGALPAEVLIAAHHGSASSTTQPFLSAVSPQWVLFSMGWKNRFGFPAESVRERVIASGAASLDTASSGAIELSVGPQGELRVAPAYRERANRLWRHHPAPAVPTGDRP
ncbi:DNA internalization-related competence protein ComEC/Rec2 [Halochromatium roseum]|uniref:DNA internalization-related competence protein ComEC/Rec2 n=1 Tax=Halochromatium roseum TaxID=391920 RepID=UPI0019129315|nr:DNA internalization-related competence protein ComEC/Rec2 [Halochromatium roseum]MBK5940000.1 DNA internalization-related competence protein ComEC/Rec2 [Halochromatium roseum]